MWEEWTLHALVSGVRMFIKVKGTFVISPYTIPSICHSADYEIIMANRQRICNLPEKN